MVLLSKLIETPLLRNRRLRRDPVGFAFQVAVFIAAMGWFGSSAMFLAAPPATPIGWVGSITAGLALLFTGIRLIRRRASGALAALGASAPLLVVTVLLDWPTQLRAVLGLSVVAAAVSSWATFVIAARRGHTPGNPGSR